MIVAGKGDDDPFLDFGAGSDVQVGDIAAPVPEVYDIGGGIAAAALSRAGCAVLLQVLAEAKPVDNIVCLFTARRNLDSRGARNAAPALQADRIVSVELTAWKKGSDQPALQSDFLLSGKDSEAAVLSLHGGGTTAAVLGIPARYLDTAMPVCRLEDIEAAGRMAIEIAEAAL